MYSDKLVYNVYIWVLFGIIFGKEKETLKHQAVYMTLKSSIYHVYIMPKPSHYECTPMLRESA